MKKFSYLKLYGFSTQVFNQSVLVIQLTFDATIVCSKMNCITGEKQIIVIIITIVAEFYPSEWGNQHTNCTPRRGITSLMVFTFVTTTMYDK